MAGFSVTPGRYSEFWPNATKVVLKDISENAIFSFMVSVAFKIVMTQDRKRTEHVR
jgi:hypothetical protein